MQMLSAHNRTLSLENAIENKPFIEAILVFFALKRINPSLSQTKSIISIYHQFSPAEIKQELKHSLTAN